MVNLVTTVGLHPILLDAFIRHYKSQGFEDKAFHIVVWGKSENVDFPAIEKVVKNHGIKIYEDMRDEPMGSFILTDIYNNITSTKPNDWWAVADVDEFQVYNQSGWYGHRVRSDLSLNSVIKFCDENKYEYHIGMLIDRIGVDGKLSKLDYGDNPFEVYPHVGYVSYSVRNNEYGKVVLQKGHHTLGGGQHEILDGGLGQWRDHCSIEAHRLIPVHHFCWTDKTHQVKSGMVSQKMDEMGECQKVIDFVDGDKDRKVVDLDKYRYFIQKNQTKQIMDVRALNTLFYHLGVVGGPESNENSFKRYDVVMSTLFLKDPYRAKQWIEYHLLLGVQHFFMYYHGRLSDLKALFPKDYDVLMDYVDKNIVTLIEWNCGITYIKEEDKYLYKREEYFKGWHHAQHAQIQHMAAQMCNSTRWMVNIDLDEFLVVRDYISLIHYIDDLDKRGIKVVSLPEILSKLDREVNYEDYDSERVRDLPRSYVEGVQYHSVVHDTEITPELEVLDFELEELSKYNTICYEYDESFTKYLWNCKDVDGAVPVVHDIHSGFDEESEKLDEYPDGKLNHEIVINHYNYGKVVCWERKLDEYKITNTNHDYNFGEMGKIKEIVKYHKSMDEDIIEYKNKVDNQ